MPKGVQIGVDIGGTFTDVVWVIGGDVVGSMKIPTTPGDRSAAVVEALQRLTRDHDIRPQDIVRFVHGTTAATNAVLERKGAKTGLLTTEGFRDILEIGRQYRRNMYDLDIRPSAPVFLVPGALRKGIRERIGANGEVVTPLDESSLRSAVQDLLEEGVEAIAVSFLFSFINPGHEQKAAALLAELAPRVAVSISSEVDPAFREYERTCITAFDAYIKPILRDYIAKMQKDLVRLGIEAPLQVMQSRGGLALADTACERPVRLFLSGPAAGVVGGQAVGDMLDIGNLITMDIGGTSCDVALIDGGHPLIRDEGMIDGYSVRVPMVDVNAIGAGGGSIAWLDKIGGLRVGPESAGSDPGPACYGRGGSRPTVTDASVVLGYIDPNYFAGGTLALCATSAREAIQRCIAAPLGFDVDQAALGIHRILNAQMAESIRSVSVGRGLDPRDYTLVALGGSGPLHATAVAEELDIGQILVPRHPGVLSAWGLLSAPVEHDASIGVHRNLADCTVPELRKLLAELDVRCSRLMVREAVAADVLVGHHADLCFVGQSYYIDVPVALDEPDALERIHDDFLAAHDRIYGHRVDGPIRIANLRAVHRAGVESAVRALPYRPVPAEGPPSPRRIMIPERDTAIEAPVWRRETLPAGMSIAGPAIIEQADTTTLIGTRWQATVLPDGNLLLALDRKAA